MHGTKMSTVFKTVPGTEIRPRWVQSEVKKTGFKTVSESVHGICQFGKILLPHVFLKKVDVR